MLRQTHGRRSACSAAAFLLDLLWLSRPDVMGCSNTHVEILIGTKLFIMEGRIT
jgi:hypothetical protein